MGPSSTAQARGVTPSYDDDADAPAPAVEWLTAREGLHVVTHHGHPKRTLTTALIVGTVLFLINQLDVVIAGGATWVTWMKSGVTYLVPFIVANIGILIATRRRPDRSR
jgi:K+ transporter